jgi:hypothetical protein
MVTQDRAIAAAEAKQLRDDPAFGRAVLAVKQRLLVELSTVDPLDTEKIRSNQASIRAIDLLAEMIANEIIRGSEQRQLHVA